jgi:serine phosphatase RsbU (regulator of sigma subunit)/anti-sigma regulatory factor (Ser/Thr protein kinase)
MSRVGIIVIAALLVEIISVVQYQRARRMLEQEMAFRSRIVLSSIAKDITHVLDMTEATMRENLWDIQHKLMHPDSASASLLYLIDDNPSVVGGCLAFLPDYYPQKGRFFEPYARKEGGRIVLEQIAGPEHDYTANPAFRQVVESGEPLWSDPYRFGPDSVSLATYSYPVFDGQGRLAAVCGLDIDLSWLGDALNANQFFPSSFGLLLTQDGRMVAGPSEQRIAPEAVRHAVDILRSDSPASADKKLVVRRHAMNRPPYWQVAQIHRYKDVFSRIRKMRLQHLAMILLGFAILVFMIERYARNEKKLRLASQEQARIAGELEVARKIQREMLPTRFPSFVYGSLEPAREVGGDLFDFFVRDGKLFFCIGDVSGKGVPSAILMSVAHSLFRMASNHIESPAHILQSLNVELCRGNDSNMFVTFFVGCLDLYSGELRYANAGHDKPYLLSADISLLPTQANLPLGVFADTVFVEQTLTMAPGNSLLLYTDGLTEAKNSGRKSFGRKGVEAVLRARPVSSRPNLDALVSALSEAAHRFAGEAPQSDDLTMLAVCFAPGEDMLRGQITLANDPREVERLSTFIKDFLGQLSMDRKTASGLRLALEETVVNVIDYAYPEGVTGSVSVLADSNRREVRFTVQDHGTPFDPTTVLEADTTLDAQKRPIGGLGILLTRKLMDSISYEHRDGQNVLILTKSIV